ncbi:MAG: TonB-dependent receptor domain-containing protein [Terriglobia bacterium]
MKTKALGILLLSIALPIALFAQQNGASVTGHIYDPSGAPVAAAKVTAKWVQTGAIFNAQSDSAGLYQLPFLNPGQYQFTVEKQGFQQIVQSGVTLTVGQKAMMDFKLQLGSVSQSINVTANAPILQTESGDRNWTIGSARIAAVPLRGLNSIMTTWFSPGVTVTSSAQKLRPFDTSGSQNESINGGQTGNNGQNSANLVLVDGISSNTHAEGVGFNAISDTVQEVNVQETMYDAEYGWSTGGVINTITKGGTNTWHGDAYEYLQNTIFNANTWGNNRTGQPRIPWHINMFGGSVGGPVIHNKLFLFFAYQQIKQVQQDPFVTSVPTAAMRSGDFSHVFVPGNNGQPEQQTIFDPLTTVCTSSGCTRSAFSGNIIPSASINPIAKAVMSYIPLPNAPGDPTTGQGNFVNTSNSRKFLDNFPEYSGRLDFNYSDKTHMFFRYSINDLDETRSYKYSTTSAFNLADTGTNSPFSRANQDFTYQVTHTFDPTTVLEFRTGMDRFTSTSGSSISNGFDPGSLGFSQTFVSQAIKYFPKFNWTSACSGCPSNYEGAGSNPEGLTPFDLTYSNELVLAKTHDRHNMKFGLQMMWIGENVESPGYAAGNFTFNGSYTAATPLTLTASTGNPVADFLLGYPSSGYIQKLSSPAISERLWSLFGQDDIHVSPKLTLNVGLRWDYLGPLSDRFNALTRGFCSTCASPLQAPGLNLQGGLEFAGVGGNPRGIYNPRYSNFDPRIGFAYQLQPQTVIRGGYGMMYAQAMDNPGAAPGFSQTTNMVASVQEGIPNPAATLADPFPTGILTPVGSSQGLVTNLGQGISFADPDMNIPRVQQYSLEVQHEFRANWMLSLGYVGSRTSRLPSERQLNALPPAALALKPTQLTASVANPFLAVPSTSPYYSLLQGTFLAAPTVQYQQLLVPYPQFQASQSPTGGGVLEQFIPIGRSEFNSFQAELVKRLSVGLDFSLSYQWAKMMDDYQFLNAESPAPSWVIDPYDVPQQVKLSAVWYLPLGPGQRFASGVGGALGRMIGGWSVSAQARGQQGMPMNFPSGVAPTGNSPSISNQSINRWFNTCTQTSTGLRDCESGEKPAWQTLQPFQLATWSPYLNSVRKPGIDDLELSVAKDTRIKERYSLKFRADFINATNTTQWFNGPNTSATSGTFGSIANAVLPTNDPRVIMLSLRFEF